jgi:hypothetical protein
MVLEDQHGIPGCVELDDGPGLDHPQSDARAPRRPRDVTLIGFDPSGQAVIAVCGKGNRKDRATLDSVEFPGLTPGERLWLQAWKNYSANSG